MPNLILAIRRYRPHQILVNLGQLASLLASPSLATLTQEDLANLVRVVPFAGTVPKAIEEKARRALPPKVNLVNGYGASEFGGVTRGFDHSHLGWLKEGCMAKVDESVFTYILYTQQQQQQ